MYCLTSDGTDEGYPVPTKFFILNEKVQSLNYGTLMAEKRNDTPNWKNLFWPSWISTTGTTGISPETRQCPLVQRWSLNARLEQPNNESRRTTSSDEVAHKWQ